MDFQKRFSIGLPVMDSVEVFDRFLDEYAVYIENVYFSLPLGDRFHSRVVTQRILRDSEKIPYFLKLLRCVSRHGIGLEVLFNTDGLTDEDIRQAKAFMDENGIEPQAIGLRNAYYSVVKKLYPNKELVYSFNNFPRDRSAYFSDGLDYHQYVVGRQYIRDRELLRQIRSRGARTVLLLNNGCSFRCGGCGNGNHCHDAYFGEREVYSPEYLYALQSIFPFEIHEGYIDTSLVDLYKIASRNADVAYLRECLDSYIRNDASGVEEDPDRYLLWSRLTWHSDYFTKFDYHRLREIKGEIYRDPAYAPSCSGGGKKLSVELDLTGAFAVRGVKIASLDRQGLLQRASEMLHIPARSLALQRIYLGISTCEQLLPQVDVGLLCRNIRYLRSCGMVSALVLPPIIRQSETLNRILETLCRENCLPDEFVANDAALFSALRKRYVVPIALGQQFDLKAYTEKSAEICCTSGNLERRELFPPQLRAFVRQQEIPYVVCDMGTGGIWIAEEESFSVSVYLNQRISKKNLLCVHAFEDACTGSCLKEEGGGLYLYSHIPLTRDVRSSLLEKRCAFILQMPLL